MHPLFVAREIAKNGLVRFSPTLAMRLRRTTGRGSMGTGVPQVAGYVWDVFEDYARVAGGSSAGLWAGRSVIELGPGDNLAVGLLAAAHGASRFVAIDRYGILRRDGWARALYAEVLRRAPAEVRARGLALLGPDGLPRLGGVLRYTADFAGAERLAAGESASLIVSRAVLEHVADLDTVLAGCRAALGPGGLMLHKVDLRDHGFRHRHPLDFLSLSPFVYELMTSARGVHNRARLSDYRRLLEQHGFRLLRLDEEHDIPPSEALSARDRLAEPFRSRPLSDLTCTTIFFAAVKA